MDAVSCFALSSWFTKMQTNSQFLFSLYSRHTIIIFILIEMASDILIILHCFDSVSMFHVTVSEQPTPHMGNSTEVQL